MVENIMNHPTPMRLAAPRCDVLAFWQAHEARVYAYLRKRVNDPALSRDLMQEVYLKVHETCLVPGRIHRPLPWLFTLSRHVIADYFRRQNRYTALETPDEVAVQESPAPGMGADGCMRALVAALPEKYRAPLRLADLEGQPQAAVAQQLGLSLSGAKSRIQRGRVMLKDLVLRCCLVQVDVRGQVQEMIPKAGCDLFAAGCE